MFAAYCGGVVDRWCREEFRKEGKPQRDQEVWLRKNCLENRADDLFFRAKRAKRVHSHKPNYDFTKIRNWILHVQDGQDLSVFGSLTPALLQKAENDMTAWFAKIGGAIGYDRHPDTKAIAQEFDDIGKTIREAGTEPIAKGQRP
jgi:hypothetical protein